MADLSIDEVWDETRRFFLREQALLIPLGFATFGLAGLLGGVVMPMPDPATGRMAPGPWMLILAPVLLLVLTGYLTVSRMALRSRISVAEALRDAFGLLPRAIGLILALITMFLTVSIVAALLAAMLSAAGGVGQAGMLSLTLAIFLPPALVISIRVALLWPTLADQERSIRETFQSAIALTRGHALKIAGLLLAYLLLYILIAGVIEAAVGSLLLIIARAIGAPSLGPVLVSVLLAAFNAVYMSFWAVFLARVYARLAGASRGI